MIPVCKDAVIQICSDTDTNLCLCSLQDTLNLSTISVQSFIHKVVLLHLVGNLKDFSRLIFLL